MAHESVAVEQEKGKGVVSLIYPQPLFLPSVPEGLDRADDEQGDPQLAGSACG